MTGYQEILTDPSYCQQIVTLTYPHIGNYGVNAEDVEAAQGPRRRPDHPRPAAARVQLPHDADAVASTCSARTPSPSPTSTPASSRASCAPRARRTAASSPGDRRGSRRRRDRRRRSPQARGARPWPAWTWPRSCRSTSPTTGRETEWQLGSGYGQQDNAEVPRRRLRLRRQAATSCACSPSAAAGHRGAGADAGRRSAGAQARRHLPVQRPRRPGALRLRDRRHARADRDGHPDLRHLPGPPDHGARLGRARPSR